MASNTDSTSGRKKYLTALVILALVLAFDQILKYWVKTHMMIGDEIPVFGNWFKLHFTENCGMAFGLKPGGDDGKIVLTIFRMLAAVGISWYLVHIIRKGAAMMAVVCFTLILAGAVGNIIDSVFYGWLFSESTVYDLATLSQGNGYAPVFKGCVVDMLYFPLIKGYFPEWLFNGRYFEFFRPIFNIADASISIGVFALILFQRSIFVKSDDAEVTAELHKSDIESGDRDVANQHDTEEKHQNGTENELKDEGDSNPPLS